MANYIVTTSQAITTGLTIAAFTGACAVALIAFLNYSELPEVYIDGAGQCTKVVNFKNGDGYTCQDKDVTLRKYHLIHGA